MEGKSEEDLETGTLMCAGAATHHSFNKYLVPILMTAVETAENKTVTVAPSWKL